MHSFVEADCTTSFKESIILGILLVDFYVGRNHQPTYEFYYPSVGSRQLGFGQLPIHPFFANLVQVRQAITCGVQYNLTTNYNSGWVEWSSEWEGGRSENLGGH